MIIQTAIPGLMVDVTDVQGYRDKYKGQMNRLETAAIDDRDRDAIKRFVVHCRTNDSSIDSLGTVVGHLNRLRLAAERSPTPLVEIDSVDDVNAFKLHLEDEHDLAAGTIRNYAKALRKFLAWRDLGFADDVSVGPPPKRRHDPDAALIHNLRQWDRGEDAALTQQYAGRIISETADRAGLNPDRIKARLFRATSISQWIRDDMGEQAIKHRTGWGKDSRMFEVYSRVTDEEMNDVVFDHYGIADADSGESGPPLEECPQCRTPLRGSEAFCPGCAAPISPDATEATDEATSALREFMVEADDADARAAAAGAAEAAENDPDFASALIDELEKLD